MKEYIEREPLEQFITDGLNNPIKEDAFGYDAVAILTHIFATPAADVVEERHGQWIIHNTLVNGVLLDENEVFVCSACQENRTRRKYNYCHNCGAKMDGGVNDGKA